ncbi:MAG: phenylacetate--CoA ligase family protein [Planctomycetota bacterium]|jgi:phenylacetate-CoA ligase
MRTNNSIEFQSVEAIEEFNNQLLRDHVQYCYGNSAYYRRVFEQRGIKPDQIKSKEDLRLLALTTKEDLEQNSESFLCVPEQEIVDICQTSGTTGKPVLLSQSLSDLERVGYNEKISFLAAGMTANDKVMIACALGRCFMAGLAYFEGVRQIGATAVRTGSGNPGILAQSVLLYRPSVIVCVPSQALLMAETIRQSGDDPAGLGVRMLICIGEPVRTVDLEYCELGQRLANIWNCDVIGTYACTEIATSFTDCSEGMGGHFHPELITVEVVDEKGDPVEPGQAGEIVATPLQVTGMPLLRYCTGDIASYFIDPCSCGRNTSRDDSLS